MTEHDPSIEPVLPVEPWQKPSSGDVEEPAPLGLVLLWCVWLLGSWVVSLWTDAAVQPAVRLMIFAAALGMLLLWPALRLSQALAQVRRRRARPAIYAAVLWDWTCLCLVLQVVIWPLYFSASWALSQAIWLDVVLLSWGLIVGLLIAVGLTLGTAAARLGAMLGCALLIFGEPAFIALTGRGGDRLHISPLHVLWDATGSHLKWHEAAWAPVILAATAAAIIGWLLVPLLLRSAKPQP